MFEEAARRAKYMAYSTKFDRETGIENLVDGETLDRMERYFDFRGFENFEKPITEALAGLETVEFPESVSVTFLVEMAGSMRGRPLHEVSLALLAATRLLEEKGVSTQVLGHTTADPKRSRPRKLWNADKAITYPGRLSELLHVVVKPFHEPASRSIGKMLSMSATGLNYENVDGEALQWAARRALAAPAAHRVLVVVADDDAPQCAISQQFADDRNFMARHLREVVGEIEASGELELLPVIVSENRRLDGVYSAPLVADRAPGELLTALVEGLAARLAPEVRPEAAAAPRL